MTLGRIQDIYPLAPMQQGMLLHSLYDGTPGMYCEQVVGEAPAGIDADAFRLAWRAVLDRTPVLCSGFVWEDVDEPHQVVLDGVPLPVEQHRWDRCRPEELKGRLRALLDDERRRGFDLATPPLLRLALIHGGGDRFVLTFHHLLLDGWSLSLLLADVQAAYQALLAGRAPQPPPRPPYREYIAWLQRQDLAGAEAFWRATLAGFGAPTAIELGPGVAGPDVPSHAECQVELAEATTAALGAFARRHRLTLNTVVQGAWAIALSRYCRERDVVFGTLVSGRPPDLAGVEDMVGLFINTLPMRVRVGPADPLVPWLARLQHDAGELRQHQHAPLARVQSWSDVPRGRALFDSVVVFENYPSEVGAEATWRLRVRRLQLTNYPVHLLVEPGRRLLLHLTYETGRVGAAPADMLLGHLRGLLQAMAGAEGATPIGELPMLTAAESRRLLVTWNPARGPRAPTRTLTRRFEAQVARTPDALAAVGPSGALTYRELERRANRLGRLLAERVGPEELVALFARRDLDLLVAILAVFKAGAAYLPLDPAQPVGRQAQLLQQSRAALVLHTAELGGAAAEALGALPAGDRPRSLALEQLGRDPAGDDPPPRRGGLGNLAYVIYTSGSSGTPKGAMVEQRGMLNHLQAKIEDLRLTGADRVAQTASQSFDISVWQFLAVLLVGGTVHILPDEVARDAARLLTEVDRDGITVLETVPSLLRALLDEAAGRTAPPRLAGLRWLVPTGEALPAALCRRWLAAYPHVPVVNAYGPTECSDDVTHHVVAAPPVGGGRLVPIGRPIGGVRLYLLDPDGRLVAPGRAGELCVGGVAVGRGYLGDPARTAEAFVPDPFSGRPGARLYRTGDLARHLPDGSLEFLDRLDHQVKVRGVRIEPGEIEAVLVRHAAVREAAVAAHGGERGDRRLVAYIVAGGPVDDAELRAFVAAALPGPMVPAAFVRLPRLPLTANGKLDRRALPDLPAAGIAAPGDGGGPRDEREATLAGVWAEVLGREHVGVHDNFFELGGDSILSMQVIAKASQHDLWFSPRQLFEHPTVAGLAAVAGTRGPIAAEQGTVTGPVPLTPVQRWLLEQEQPEPDHWNMGILLEARERLDPVLFARAVALLAAHHDALRLRFSRDGDEWRQEHGPVEPGPPCSRLELAGLPSAEREAAVARLAAELHRGLDLGGGPLARVGLVDPGPGAPHRLVVVAHHLVVDGVSWPILLSDLETAYQLLRGEPVSLPAKTTSFQTWARRLAGYARSPEVRREATHWLGLAGGVLPLPADGPGGDNLEGSTATATAQLTPEETRAVLEDLPAAFGARVEEVLLGAVAGAVAAWAGSGRLLVEVEGHGREALFDDVNLSRTVGWFTALFPVALEVAADEGPAAAVAAARRALGSVPHRGVGYGLLRYLGDDPLLAERLRALPAPQLLFTYLGRFDQVLEGSMFTSATWIGPAKAAANRRRHVLEVAAAVLGGRLQVRWIYSRALHRAAIVAALAEATAGNLRVLIEKANETEVMAL
jgi:amino acid adenylation domain-containing protein/non-ribosomal peptide synthase protein (TIGR01720 family)